jgi:hypothetical protein
MERKLKQIVKIIATENSFQSFLDTEQNLFEKKVFRVRFVTWKRKGFEFCHANARDLNERNS